VVLEIKPRTSSMGSRVEAYEDINTVVLNILQVQPQNRARARGRAAAFPKMFMSNNL
jgi:hypothetical protein